MLDSPPREQEGVWEVGPKKLSTNGKVALALRLVEDPHHSIDDICSTLGISRSTLYRYMREAKRASRPSDPPA
jgi:hypothetical protein